MPRPIHSFDVFDTLIARRCVEPRRVLEELETRSSLPGLADVRVAADRRLGELGQPYDLRQIWQDVRDALGLDAATADRLFDLEIDLEYEQVIPIVENLGLVRDGDLLVSDTYLPPNVVLSLLHRVGLHRRVGLIVSNDGKFRGRIWPQLLANVAIVQHFGDNPHSDGRTPTAAGIPSVIYTGARRSPVEEFLTKFGWASLADLTREVRLANPFPVERSDERYLWALACQLNFPLLVFGSVWLEQQVAERSQQQLCFVSRDCLLWHRLFSKLFPERDAVYLFASRLCQFKPSEDYLSYFRSLWRADSVIVDLTSTGTSWARFFARLGHRGACCLLGFCDGPSYLPQAAPPEQWLDVVAVFRTSEIGGPLTKGLEMLNYAPHARVEDVVRLPGGAFLPVMAAALEYEVSLPEAAHRSFEMCVDRLEAGRIVAGASSAALPGLIREFVRWICADPRLPRIYSGHFAADSAYQQQVLAE